ncbi:AEC family transporter [Streptomyces zhihengii]
MFAVGLVVGRRVFRRRPADRAIGAMAGSYVNSANLGIPVAVQLLGDASFVIAVALFQTLFVTPVVIALIELDTGGERRRPLRLLLLPLRNPVIAASAAGTAVAALGLRLPPEATAPVEMLGGAAVPAALFALGLSLHRRREGAAPPRSLSPSGRGAASGTSSSC